MGTSAGAHIAMLQAYSDHALYKVAPDLQGISANVRYLVNIYGPTELVSLFHLQKLSAENFPADLFNYACLILKAMTGCDPLKEKNKIESILKKYSPLTYVQQSDHPLVPCLTLHGEADEQVAINQAVMLQQALTDSHTENEFYSYPQVMHAFEKMTAQQEQKMRHQCLKFIFKQIKRNAI